MIDAFILGLEITCFLAGIVMPAGAIIAIGCFIEDRIDK